MRKNKMMRTAAVLGVATMLTASVLSGTFAKYTTQSTGQDSARVAKWGVVLQADGTLYGKNYGTGTTTPTTTDAVASLSVKAEANAVAPGTKNDKGLHFSVNGTPEVRTKLTATIKGQNIYLAAGTYAVMVKAPQVTETSWKANTYYTGANDTYTLSEAYTADATYYTKESEVTLNEIYYPVVYKSTDVTAGNNSADSLKAIVEDYAKKLGSETSATATETNNEYTYTVTKEYDPNKKLEDLGVAGEDLTWAWTFENTDSNKDNYNKADTILADLQADTLSDAKVVKLTTDASKNDKYVAPTEHTDYNLETSFSIDIKAEQVD